MENWWLWIVCGILILIVTGGLVFGLPSTKGWAGERLVRMVLKSLPKDKYKILNDVYFRKGKWSCQIDHLVISPYGIFCIETKNYLGVTQGDYKDKLLQRRVLGMKYNTYSPIHQNYRHLQRLVEMFPLIKSYSDYLHSIVCFMPGGTPKIKGGGVASVCTIKGLKRSIVGEVVEKIPQDDFQTIYNDVRKFSRSCKN